MNWYKISKVNKLELYTAKLSKMLFEYIKAGNITSGNVKFWEKEDHQIPIVDRISLVVVAKDFYDEQKAEYIAINANVQGNKNILISVFTPEIHIPTRLLQDLSYKLKYIFRHELEHILQPIEEGVSSANYGKSNDANDIINYWLSKSEKEAYVVGLYYWAKKSHRTFADSLEDLLRSLVQIWLDKGLDFETAKSIADRMRVEYLTYADKRFPKAKMEELKRELV